MPKFSLKRLPKTHLRRVMAERGLSGPEVAKILGVKAQTVNAYMCGVRRITRRQLERVINYEVR